MLNDIIVIKRNSGGNWQEVVITAGANKVFGTDSDGNPVLLTTLPSGVGVAWADVSGKPAFGGAALLNTGTTIGTVAAGNDSRITGSAQKASNLSDLADAAAALANLGGITPAAVDAKIVTAVTGLYDIKGNIACNTNPNYPTALKGDVYVVSAAGKIGGASGRVVSVGDTVVCTTDAAAGDQATVGASWNIGEANIPGITPIGTALMTVATPAAPRYIQLANSGAITLQSIAQLKAELALDNVNNTLDSQKVFTKAWIRTNAFGTYIAGTGPSATISLADIDSALALGILEVKVTSNDFTVICDFFYTLEEGQPNTVADGNAVVAHLVANMPGFGGFAQDLGDSVRVDSYYVGADSNIQVIGVDPWPSNQYVLGTNAVGVPEGASVTVIDRPANYFIFIEEIMLQLGKGSAELPADLTFDLLMYDREAVDPEPSTKLLASVNVASLLTEPGLTIGLDAWTFEESNMYYSGRLIFAGRMIDCALTISVRGGYPLNAGDQISNINCLVRGTTQVYPVYID